MGITTPTQIQRETIPPMMAGTDIIGIAPTGTGKTLAFGIPMLEYISLTETRVQELVLAPTRELAMQIVAELTELARFIPQIRIATLYGGQPMTKQINQLKRNPQIVVATPGRLLDMVNRGHVRLNQVHTLVLDEADEMLKMGFVKDVTKIIDLVPHTRQLVMFSATTNRDVLTISWKYQQTPVEITVEATKENRPQITQYTMIVPRENKMAVLQYLLDADEFDRVMVFVNTKWMTQKVAERLQKQGYQAEALHGDVRQSQRTRIMNDYKRGKFPILVSTDVAARGIDVDDVEAVINYDLPNENEYYLHRIGRTGRARKHGVSFTMLTFQETVRMDEIMKYMQSKPKPLHFDEGKVLRHEDGEAFFEHI
ncbi:MAG: DEAD/DEAH box helicase [Clostridiales bacterium]|nr:DEAD/DEAH box helicase [Clostridiales bacterium]